MACIDAIMCGTLQVQQVPLCLVAEIYESEVCARPFPILIKHDKSDADIGNESQGHLHFSNGLQDELLSTEEHLQIHATSRQGSTCASGNMLKLGDSPEEGLGWAAVVEEEGTPLAEEGTP